MVISTRKPVYARDRHGENRASYPAQATPFAWAKRLGFCACLIFALAAWSQAIAGVRIASFNVSLGRKGPGLLLRDIVRGKDPQIDALLEIIANTSPDILLLNGFDYDRGNNALAAFAGALRARGADYPHWFALAPNSGFQSGIDLDGDGRTGGPGDAQGYGRFPGSSGMAILSKYPILSDRVQDYSPLLWKDFPNALLPQKNGAPFPSAGALKVQRLSSKGHWDVPVKLPDGRILRLLAANPTPPVFDGPEDRNGRRNHDEIRFWSAYLTAGKVQKPFVIAGDLNADPKDGAGLKDAIGELLSRADIQDPAPASNGAAMAAVRQGGANRTHKTPARLDTVDWNDANGPGNMRVDYVLPSIDLTVTGAGVFWPGPDEPGNDLLRRAGKARTRHRLVWVDIK